MLVFAQALQKLEQWMTKERQSEGENTAQRTVKTSILIGPETVMAMSEVQSFRRVLTGEAKDLKSLQPSTLTGKRCQALYM